MTGAPEIDLPPLVSVDDHVVEPPALWVERIATRYHDVCPRVSRERIADLANTRLLGPYKELTLAAREGAPEWVDVWRYEDVLFPIFRSYASAGLRPDEADQMPTTYEEMRPGFYEAKARVDDMREDGVDVSLCFPNIFLRFCGQRFLEARDRSLALLCIRAYNDWLIEGWSGPSGGHLLGAALIPLWDPDLAADEVRRNASRGCRAVTFSEIPTRLGLPSLYSGAWDPFFGACEETGLVIMMHIGSSSTQPETSPDAPAVLKFANHYINSSLSLTDWILSGQFIKFPKLRIAYAEAQAGWIPFIMTRLDNVWKKGNFPAFMSANAQSPRLRELPSAYLHDHVYTCVFDDFSALANTVYLGEDTMCFETDYPHPDGSWPDSRGAARLLTADVSDALRLKILRTNGLRLLGLDC